MCVINTTSQSISVVSVFEGFQYNPLCIVSLMRGTSLGEANSPSSSYKLSLILCLGVETPEPPPFHVNMSLDSDIFPVLFNAVISGRERVSEQTSYDSGFTFCLTSVCDGPDL